MDSPETCRRVSSASRFDVIVTGGMIAVIAAKRATSTIVIRYLTDAAE
jgi:hypothetical protein